MRCLYGRGDSRTISSKYVMMKSIIVRLCKIRPVRQSNNWIILLEKTMIIVNKELMCDTLNYPTDKHTKTRRNNGKEKLGNKKQPQSRNGPTVYQNYYRFFY